MRVMLFPLVAAFVATPLWAADQAPPPPQAQWQRPTPAEAEARRAEWEAKRSADIALLLGLRADQKPALDTYLAARHPHHDGHGFKHDANGAPGSEGTMASLDRMSRRIDAHDAEAKQRIEATRRFYASLTHDQQQRFDALDHLAHGRRGGRGMHGDHGPHDGHAMG